jgi:hypothetical protein
MGTTGHVSCWHIAVIALPANGRKTPEADEQVMGFGSLRLFSGAPGNGPPADVTAGPARVL